MTTVKTNVYWCKEYKNGHLNRIEIHLSRVPNIGELISILGAIPGGMQEVQCKVVRVIHYPNQMFGRDINAALIVRPLVDASDFYPMIPLDSKDGEAYE